MKKNRFLLVLCTAFVLLFSSGAYAQDADKEYRETLHKMLVISGGLSTAEAMVPQLIEMLKRNSPDIPEAYLKALSDGMTEKLVKRMVEVCVPIYRKYLTLDDLKGIIAFYDSPVGVKLGKVQPFISRESMQVGEQIGLEIAKDIQKAINSYNGQ